MGGRKTAFFGYFDDRESGLCEIIFELCDMGAENINLVTPDMYIPQIIPAIIKAKVKRKSSCVAIYTATDPHNRFAQVSEFGMIRLICIEVKNYFLP